MRILTEPDASLTKQYAALLATEGVRLEFTRDGVRRIAEIAFAGQRAHREHRRAPAAHGDGAAAGDVSLRGAPTAPAPPLVDRRRLRRSRTSASWRRTRTWRATSCEPMDKRSLDGTHGHRDHGCGTQSRLLELAFDDGSRFELPFEYLRVYSPSAEVRGHGPGQETLQLGKHEVGIAPHRAGRQLRGASWSSTTATTPACTPGTTCTSSGSPAGRTLAAATSSACEQAGRHSADRPATGAEAV